MKKSTILALSVVMLGSAAFSFAGCENEKADVRGDAFSSADATLTLDMGDTSREISDSLFGLFLEDINYASYAIGTNLISNGNFSHTTPTRNWAANGASLTAETEGAFASANPLYAKIDITDEGATVTNSGYDACTIAVEEGKSYDFTAFLKATDYEGNLTARIRNNTKVVAEKSIAVTQSDDWKKYQITLTATETADKNLYFELCFDSTGTILMDGAQLLMQEGKAGLRPYVYDAIEGLNPSFIRFPGGCVIEGRTMKDAYDWKNSIGVDGKDKATELSYTLVTESGTSAVESTGEYVTRASNIDIWQNGSNYYNMDYGLGFYEYFLLCDSLGAKAVPIVNCGLSCMIQTSGFAGYNVLEGRYGNGIQDYIQDALDLVAFAKGDVNSSDENEAYWAGVRAAMGHAEPFEMDYIGIGNEQWGNKYYDYYQQFLVAFADAAEENELYSSVRLIVGNGVAINDVEQNGSGGTAKKAAEKYVAAGKIDNLLDYGVQDHHYYMDYYSFFRHAKLYDTYSREDDTRYDVFVGEYSANTITGTYATEKNSWVCALSEAAYMTGLERNGDVVKLAAYAPMFGAVASTFNQWPVDMMYYTNTELLLSANYYVQQIYANNCGTNVIGSALEYAKGVSNKTRVDGKADVEKLYQVVSKDEKTGDIIIKLVNAGEEEINVNINLGGARYKGVANVTVLINEELHVYNTLEKPETISPETYTLSLASTIGFCADAYSLNVIRIRTK